VKNLEPGGNVGKGRTRKSGVAFRSHPCARLWRKLHPPTLVARVCRGGVRGGGSKRPSADSFGEVYLPAKLASSEVSVLAGIGTVPGQGQVGLAVAS